MAEAGKTNEYEFTDRAGRRVAGRIVERGKTIWLSDAEAEHGLAEGTIVPKGEQLHKAFTEDTKPLARMRDEAQAFRARTAPPADAPAEDPAPAQPPAPGPAA